MDFPTFMNPRNGYVSTIIPAAALAAPVGAVWYQDCTNHGAGIYLEPIINEIIGTFVFLKLKEVKILKGLTIPCEPKNVRAISSHNMIGPLSSSTPPT